MALQRRAHRAADRLSGDLLARQRELSIIAGLLKVKAVADPLALRETLYDLARCEYAYP